MNDVAELKSYIEVHAKGQGLDGYREVLARIGSDDGAEPGSWAAEWCREGERLEKLGRFLEASRHYAMARFPYVDGDARHDALERCVTAFDRWRADVPAIERLDVKLEEGLVRCWTSGLSSAPAKPLLIMMGGNMTVKEQWAPMLVHAERLGMAAIVTEMPSVGENTVPYEPSSHRVVSRLLDEVADRADVSRTHLTMLSFSGHLALRCAVDDDRIKGVITVGAPIRSFFLDRDWYGRIPGITAATLAHMTGKEEGVAGDAAWALTPAELEGLTIPVAYAASLRDEVIPYEDVRLVKERVRRLDLVEYDDVHASPGHTQENQLWTTRALLRARGVRGPATATLAVMLAVARLRRRLRRAA
uniref:PyrD4 n=1 Tax=Streptomyces rugosporus TaxID=295838 RepID=K7QQB1_STRRG|nr:PyrD4 [Streptomyces rugosporus]